MDIDHFNPSDIAQQINYLLLDSKMEEALALINREISANPTALNHSLKGFIYACSSEYVESRASISQALSIDSNDPEVLAKCAVSLQVMGRIDLGIELLKLVPFIPGNSAHIALRFDLLLSITSLAQLRKRLKAITKIDPSNIFQPSDDPAKQGLLLALSGDLENSANLLKAELLKNPLNTKILGMLGCIAIYNLQSAVADEYLRLALQLEPNNSELLLLRSITMLLNTRSYESYLEAYDLLKHAADLAPDSYAVLEQLAAASMFLHRYEESNEYFVKLQKLRQEAISSRGLSAVGLAVLSYRWVTNIGHYWGLESFVKEILLGKTHFKAGLVLCSHKPANAALLSYFEPYMRFVTDPDETETLQAMPEQHFWSSEHAQLSSGTMAFIQRPLAMLDNEWNQSGRGPLMTLRPDHEDHGWQMMEKMGIPRDAWFVSLHARSMGFYEVGSRGGFNESRSADLGNYLEAIKLITDRGGWVIRMGDPSMAKLPSLPNVIDYAHCNLKSDWMDVFLWAKCKFFLGTLSGPQHIPPMFGVPVVMVNMPSIRGVAQIALKKDVAIPKMAWLTKERRFLTFQEALTGPAATFFANSYTLKHLGIELIENSGDEILAAVSEMFDRLDNRYSLSDADAAAQKKLLNYIPNFPSSALDQLLGRDFLRKYNNLI